MSLFSGIICQIVLPCGTGTSAKLAALYAKGEIKIGEPFVYESFIGSQFKGVIKEESNCGAV